MKLPNAELAIVDIEKLRDYCLSRSHPRGRHKARVFESALGITDGDAEELRQALLNAAHTQHATDTVQDEYGQRFVLDFSLKRGSREALVRSSWIIRAGEKEPRLATCYVV
jgi:hypothetical protein